MKAEPTVQPDRGMIRAVADHSNHLPHPARLGSRDQSRGQPLAQTGAETVRADIDGIFHRLPIRWTRTIGCGIRISANNAVVLGHKPRQAPGCDFVPASRHFSSIRWFGFKRSGAVVYVM